MWRLAIGVPALLLAIPAAAQDAAAIQGVIRDQMEAFVAGDVNRAFDYASPGIQGMFGSPGNFGRMVEEGYPMVWRPGDLSFGALREDPGEVWQRVIVRDGSGALHALDYRMEQIGGIWRIAGVIYVPAPEVGV